MNVLVYSRPCDRINGIVHRFVKKSDREISVERYETVDGIVSRLRAPGQHFDVGVLSFASQAEIREFVGISGLFGSIRLIVVAPESDRQTVALAHQLRPRFLTFRGIQLTPISQVFEHMVGEDWVPHSR